MADFKIDDKEYKKMFKQLKKFGNKRKFRKEINLWLEAIGFEFLDLVQDEIIKKEVVNTRLLLNSFDKGTGENVWKADKIGLSLEVGTNIDYASFVNDGHWTNKRGTSIRFVPGEWQGDRFVYIKGYNSGMILKRKWIEGRHYWESSLKAFEPVFKKSLEKSLEKWIKKIEGGF